MLSDRKFSVKFYLFVFGFILLFITFYMYAGFDLSVVSERNLKQVETNHIVSEHEKWKSPLKERSEVIKPKLIEHVERNDTINKSNSVNNDVFLKTQPKSEIQILLNETLQDPAVRKIVPYRLGDQNINWVEWENRCVMPTDLDANFQYFAQLVCPESNAIDIGAHSGDTAVAIAASTRGGVTYAYEPHPKTYHILSLQEKLNPSINLKSFNIALMKDNRNKMWWNGVGDGCNGGIQGTSCGKSSPQCMEIKSEDVVTHFNKVPDEFLKRLSFIKVDTEGNDRHILRGLKDSVLRLVRPLILIEWFTEFKGCNTNAKDMFSAIEEIGYKPYGFSVKDNGNDIKPATCDNYLRDLLLLPKENDININGIQTCPN